MRKLELAKLDHVSIAAANWRAARDWHVRNPGLEVEFEAPEGGPAGSAVELADPDGDIRGLWDETAMREKG